MQLNYSEPVGIGSALHLMSTTACSSGLFVGRACYTVPIFIAGGSTYNRQHSVACLKAIKAMIRICLEMIITRRRFTLKLHLIHSPPHDSFHLGEPARPCNRDFMYRFVDAVYHFVKCYHNTADSAQVYIKTASFKSASNSKLIYT